MTALSHLTWSVFSAAVGAWVVYELATGARTGAGWAVCAAINFVVALARLGLLVRSVEDAR